MAELSSQPSAPSNNIYTALMAIAVVTLLLGVGYVWYRFAALFETPNPFSVSGSDTAMQVIQTLLT